MKRRLLSVLTAAALALTGGLAGAPPASAATGTLVSARSLLNKLVVGSETHRSSYDRATGFGADWIDADHDCELTRAEVLKSESSVKVTESRRCKVLSGEWLSKYDGKAFTEGWRLRVDHLVPLAEAWSSGAWAWNASKRRAYANDLGYSASLIGVSAAANQAKLDKEPNAYLPPVRGYRCTYVRNWIAVKYRWNLMIDPAEKTALGQDLTTYCRTATRDLVAMPALIRATKVVTLHPWTSASTSKSPTGAAVECGLDSVSGRTDVRLCTAYPCFIDPSSSTRVACPATFPTTWTLRRIPADTIPGRFAPSDGQVFAIKLSNGDRCHAFNTEFDGGTRNYAVMTCDSGARVWQTGYLDKRVRGSANPFEQGLDSRGRWLVTYGKSAATPAKAAVTIAYR